MLYFVAVQHLTRLAAAGYTDIERFILVEGGVVTGLFWIGQIILGGLVPLALLFAGPLDSLGRGRVLLAAGLVIGGGFAQLYVIIIGGQAVPLTLFPGMEVSSSFFDGEIGTYLPSLPEFGLGLGAIAIAAIAAIAAVVALIGLRILPFLPASLADPPASLAETESTP